MDGEALVEKVLTQVGDLPAMPTNVAEVLATIDRPEADLSEVSAKIERDPGLSAKILRISNSPFYGMKQSVGSLKLALVVLGVREVRNIVLGISVFDMLQDENLDKMMMERFWEHSVRVGALSKKMGTAFALGLQGEDFMSGLLHDIGKMILFRQLGGEYEQIFTMSGGCGAGLCELECQFLGFDHADAAAALALQWNLPVALVDAIWWHHTGRTRAMTKAKDPRLAALVRIANLASHDDWKGEEDGAAFASCEDEEAWALLADRPDVPGDAESRRATLAAFVEELEGAAPPPMF